MRLFSNLNAAAMGIPRFINNSLKPWIYINFRSEETMQAALEIAPTLNNRQLIWDRPDNVKNFCPRCSNPDHKAKDCDDIRSRGRKPTPKALINVYKKHGIVNAATKLADKQTQQQQRTSKAKSRSRSRSRRPNVDFAPNTTDQGTPAGTYAEVLNNGPNGLNNSVHAPQNRNNTNNNKEKETSNNNNIRTLPLNLSKESIKDIAIYMKQVEEKLNKLTENMSQWKEALDSIDSRFENIEKHLNITPPKAKTPTVQIDINNPKPPTLRPPKQVPIVRIQQQTTSGNNAQQNKTSPAVTPSVASSSTTANNNNNAPTVQSLSNEFNTMQGDVASLKDMMQNLTTIMQNAMGQQQESNPNSLH
jgi:hypothetical protein